MVLESPEFFCSFVPDLSDLDEQLAQSIVFNTDAQRIQFSRELSKDELHLLRSCHLDSEEWLSLIDRLEEHQQVSQLTAASAYPATNWSLLLTQLGGGEDDAWLKFMSSYRKPIEKSLAKILRNWNQAGYSSAQLADDFFGWFCEKQYYKKLKRTDDQGKILRFRGYLKFVLKYYLKDAVLPKRSTANIHNIDESALSDLNVSTGEIDKTIDQEICHDLAISTLEVMKRDEFASWRSFLADLSGLTLSEVSEKLKADSQSKGSSVSQVHRERSRARDQFRNWLLRYRLESGCVSREEALEEFHDLIPVLAQSLSDYREAHKGEID